MTINLTQLNIAANIDKRISALSNEITNTKQLDDAVLAMIPEYFPDMEEIINSLESKEFSNLTKKYPRYTYFIDMMLKLADAIEEGVFDEDIALAS